MIDTIHGDFELLLIAVDSDGNVEVVLMEVLKHGS